MSKEIGIIREAGSRKQDLSITQFWGGVDVGVCVQLTQKMEDGSFGYVQLSAADIVAILPALKSILDVELERKKNECEEAIKNCRELEKSILKDMREVAQMSISQVVLDYAALLVIGKKEIDTSEAEE